MSIIVALGALSLGTMFGWALHGALMRQVALMKERELYDLYELNDDDWDSWNDYVDSDVEFGSVPNGSANGQQVEDLTEKGRQ